MARWECIVCGLIYDEKLGWPDDGIAPGTKWADVPEDWLCPDCGVGKEDFELLDTDDDDTHTHASAQEHIVVIGTGLAGYNLVREIRKHDKDVSITMLSSDDGNSYSKPMLSTGFTKGKDAAQLVMKNAAGMVEQLSINIKPFTTVKAIDTQTQALNLDNNETINYTKLVIAWGAQAIRPPLTGDAADEVFSINDLLDYAKFRKAIEANKAKDIVIIGGGLIGCEFTNDLLNGGFNVQTIDPLDYCLPTLLPEVAGQAVRNALETQGAKFHFGPLVTEVNHDGDKLRISLSKGECLHADIVVSAIGVRPRIELAQAAGIACNRGIIANQLLETSAANVYTLGDCAEVAGHVLYYVAPLMNCAKALANTLTGTPTQVEYPAMPVTIKTPSCPVVVSPPAHDASGEWHITQQDGNNTCAEFRNVQGELLGFALTGDLITEKIRLQKELPAIL